MVSNNLPNIEIFGFSSNINDVMDLMSKINELKNKSGENCTIQLLNADGIAGIAHILHASIHAVNAFNHDDNIANDLGLEICVRASAQRQISKALDILGLKTGEMNICAVLVNCSRNLMDELENILGKRDDEVLKPDEIILKRIYNISDEELETTRNISNVMIERTTLLALEY